ncbi:uncharacterized protein PV06_01785 [Exophiala oligosperma]|uniref:Transcription factor domain-containing protein n=1 Tax=Exophiala oligosperma TaxID=215243 RepID=A0A0D2DUB4_9EURO|nr:uncharacterized protein PV06_01785 [Exophiala oligosperma]KIW46095.1 hypothetical protein PV06_01785 [Exophiala oligosperma]
MEETSSGRLVIIVQSGRSDEGVSGQAKSAINSHIAKISHQRRRRKKVQEALTDPPQDWLPQKRHLFRDYSQSSPPEDKLDYHRLGAQADFHHVENVEDDERSGQVYLGQSRACRMQSPRTVLGKGNSDPFDSLAVVIDPWANRFMDFGKTYLIPALYQTGNRGWAPSSPAARNWHAGIKDLSDRCAAFGLMSYYATALTIISNDANAAKRALVLKTKAVELLRHQLVVMDALGSCIDTNTQGLIFRLFRAEILGRNSTAALLHGRMLRSSLERQCQAGTLDLAFLSVSIYHDNFRSTSSMEWPIFDYEELVPAAFAAVWKRVPLTLPKEAEEDLGEPDPSITDPKLRQTVKDMRPFFLIYSLMATRRKTSASPTDWFWFLSRSETFQGQLMNRYLRLVKEAAGDSQRTAASQLQACICLATLYTIRAPVNNPQVSGMPLYDSATIIQQRLADGLFIVEQCLLFNSKALSAVPNSDGSLLWMYYVGTLAESRCQSLRTPMVFFESRLSAKIAEMRIDSWESMVSIFKAFLFSDVYCVPYNPEQWFATIKAHGSPYSIEECSRKQRPAQPPAKFVNPSCVTSFQDT